MADRGNLERFDFAWDARGSAHATKESPMRQTMVSWLVVTTGVISAVAAISFALHANAV